MSLGLARRTIIWRFIPAFRNSVAWLFGKSAMQGLLVCICIWGWWFYGAHSLLVRVSHTIHDITPSLKITILLVDVCDHLFLSQVSYLTFHGGFERLAVFGRSPDEEIIQAHPDYRIINNKEVIHEPEVLNNISHCFATHHFQFLHLIDYIIVTHVSFRVMFCVTEFQSLSCWVITISKWFDLESDHFSGTH